MNTQLHNSNSASVQLPLLTGVRSWVLQVILVSTAVALPAAAHLTGAPVRILLPMHWPIIFAGLLLGWRGGLLVGLAAPLTNYILTGYPLFPKMVAMTIELGTIGCVVGLLRVNFKFKQYASIAIAILLGRVLFLSVIVLLGAFNSTFVLYLMTAVAPGLVAACMQIILLPTITNWFIKLYHHNRVDDSSE